MCISMSKSDMSASMNASTDQTEHESGPARRPVRVLAIGGLVVFVGILLFLVLGRGNGHTYDLVFETGGQLVRGNLVMVGGHPVGSVSDISLTDNNQARIRVDVDQELHEGTTAVVRATSLSGVANRYISLSPGPNSAPALPDGGELGSIATTSPVDLDQFFNTFTPRMRKGLSDFIQGNAAIWDGKGPEANRAFKYFSPALTQTTLWLREFNADQRALTRFVADSARLSTTVASRGDELTSLISNSNQSFGAIAAENRSLSQALGALPGTLRQANTTFVNLRAAFDDLDPLVEASLPATKDLAPFLHDLQPVLSRGVSTFHDLSLTMSRPGKANDMGELTQSLPKVQPSTRRAFKSSIKAISDFQPTLDFMRPYWGEAATGFSNLGQISAYYDAAGHFVRIQPGGMNLFDYDSGSGQLNPLPMADQFDPFPAPQRLKRCPGGGTQPAADGSNPFYDPPWGKSGLSGDDCDPSQVPPGS